MKIKKMRHGSLFSGIGGFDLAAQWMGWENKFHCEWNEFGQKVLKYYWPDAESFSDITKTDFKKYANRIDILTGGFPCQPYSVAGKRKGKEDERHLWPEMLRAIREIQPRWVVGENVSGLINWSGGLVFHEVQTDLEAAGYEVWPYVLPACAVNAPHRRDRVWFVAYSHAAGQRSNKWESENEENAFAKNANEDGWRSNQWKEESGIRQFRNIGSGNNERVCPDNGKVRVAYKNDVTNTEGIRQQGFIREEQKDPRFTRYSNTSFTSDTECERLQKSEQSEQQQPLFNVERNDSQNASDTNGIGLWGQSNSVGESGFFNEKSQVNDWQNFPTQSPVCNGDDGIPSQLDGITFPKWRNESIKAGGNAVVPQVVFQIFKAIEEYENLTVGIGKEAMKYFN